MPLKIIFNFMYLLVYIIYVIANGSVESGDQIQIEADEIGL